MPDTVRYQHGEIVDITIRGARVVRYDDDTVTIRYGRVPVVYGVQLGDDVTVERVAPAEWPPRPGDLWRDRDGALWFVAGTDRRGMRMYATSGDSADPDHVNRRYGPITLVHREPQDGGDEQ